MAPTISIKVNGVWTPIGTLPEQEREKIKERVAAVLREALVRQIGIMNGREQAHEPTS